MTSQWEMRVALASLESEALAIAPLQGWGLVMPAGDGLVSYQMRHQWGTTVNVLPVTVLPPALRTPIGAIRQVSPLRRGDGPVDATLVMMGIASLLVVPLPG